MLTQLLLPLQQSASQVHGPDLLFSITTAWSQPPSRSLAGLSGCQAWTTFGRLPNWDGWLPGWPIA